VVFKWDSTEAATNLRKHKVDFHEAATVQKDILSMAYPDVDHSNYEPFIEARGNGKSVHCMTPLPAP
jgi:uncharacterized DUF497 family protein